MTEKNDIELFQKQGYLIKKTKNTKALYYLQKKIVEFILTSKPNLKKKILKNNHIKFFEDLHKHVSKKDLNNLRLSAINKLNKDKKFSKNYYIVCKDVLDTIVGNEIAMQKKINLSIQMPNEQQSRLPMHSDIYAGESPFEVVMWIPLMNIDACSHSMFITNPKSNKKINEEVTKSKNKSINEIYLKYKKHFKYIKISFGEILIFTPILQHGNQINKTNITRSSLNCRFKSLLSPYDVFSKTHRNIPHFYKPLNIKPLTKIGFNFINSINKKKFFIND
jgi:sporadic carbohydrate cluster 2OG-Fe(II) oxygenase